MLESTVNVKNISQEWKIKYKLIMKAKETRFLKLNNLNKSEFFSQKCIRLYRFAETNQATCIMHTIALKNYLI